jgi:hypothetical protein
MNWLLRWYAPRPLRGATSRRPVASRLRLEALEDRQVPTVTYHGGPLLPHVEAQALYLGNSWSTSPTPTTLEGFLTYVTNSPYMTALTNAGYGVGAGSRTPGPVDGSALTSTITDAFIQSRIASDVASGLLAAPDANRLYIVYVQPDVAVNLGRGQGSTQQGILGYHGAFVSNGATLRYAVVAYPGGTVGNTSLGTAPVDQLTAITSHELAEAVTDPDVTLGHVGWYDDNRNGEIGDITQNNPNALVRLNGWLVQQVANQNDGLLVLNGGTINPTPINPAPINPQPVGTIATTTRLSAGPVRYHRDGTASVTLTVQITPSSGAVGPDGTVQLIYQGSVLGSKAVQVAGDVGQVTFTVTFPSFTDTRWDYYSFTARYTGSGHFGASTSHAVTVAV